jgi:hypothetical protein
MAHRAVLTVRLSACRSLALCKGISAFQRATERKKTEETRAGNQHNEEFIGYGSVSLEPGPAEIKDIRDRG